MAAQGLASGKIFLIYRQMVEMSDRIHLVEGEIKAMFACVLGNIF